MSDEERSEEKKGTSSALILVLAIAALAVMFSALSSIEEGSPGGSSAPLCADSRYKSEVRALLDRWDDANQLASSTARIALSGPLSQLQELRREARQIAPPDCMEPAHRALLSYMDSTIEGYFAFLGDDEDEAARHLESAGRSQDRFIRLFTSD